MKNQVRTRDGKFSNRGQFTSPEDRWGNCKTCGQLLPKDQEYRFYCDDCVYTMRTGKMYDTSPIVLESRVGDYLNANATWLEEPHKVYVKTNLYKVCRKRKED